MKVSVRYIVDDVQAAIAFYVDQLGFDLEMNPAPGFAMLKAGDLRMYLNSPGAGGGGSSMPDGTVPEAGGWNRIQIEVDDIDAAVGRLGAAGVTFRGEVVVGTGGSQIVAEDPAGNPVELFQPGSA